MQRTTEPGAQAHPATPAVGSILSALRRRQRALAALRWAANAMLAGAAVGCAAAVAGWAISAASPALLAALAMGTMCGFALIGAALGAAMPVSDLALARALDKAAASEDRFASAVQLARHHRQERVSLIVEDALTRVSGTTPAAALPLRTPRTLRWVPVPLLVLAVMLLALPQPRTQAAAQPEPEISADQWASLHDQFKKELEQLPRPQTAEEEALQKELEKLAELLKQKPDAKDALAEIARLSEKIEQQRKATGAGQNSLKNAARAVAASQALKQFAAKLQQGDYEAAAAEMQKTAQQLKQGELSPDAGEFEAMSADLQQLAAEMNSQDELQQACQQAAAAAGKMNKKDLSDAMKKFSEQLKKNASKLKQCDGLCKRQSMLDALRRQMSQCQGQCNRPGSGFCNGNRPGMGDKKGGKQAGWGTAAKWDGGQIHKADEQRTPDLAALQEQSGASTTFQTISPDERAQSSLTYQQRYADFVQKSEAELDLDSVPLAYREYLRRYFAAIRPKDAAPASSGENHEPEPAAAGSN